MNSHSPFSIKVLLSARSLLKFYFQWHLYVFPKHDKPYINQICVYITFDWPLAKGTSCSSKTLIWVQTLSDIKGSHKKFSVCNSKFKNWWELFWQGLKLKIQIKEFFTNFCYVSNQGISAAIYINRLIKKPLSEFHMLEAYKSHGIWLDGSVKILDIHHSIFLRQGRSGKWRFVYGGIWSN